MWSVRVADEPWAYDYVVEEKSSVDSFIGYLTCFTDEEAIRVVACVNACEGIPTEELENLKVVTLLR